MTLQFVNRRSYGHDRYYPANAAAEVLVQLTGRPCLKREELDRLAASGFFKVVLASTGPAA